MDKEPTYRNPVSFSLEENETLEGTYRLSMYLDEKEVGFCRIEERPDGSYYISGLAIRPEYRSKKEGGTASKYSHLGSDLIKCVNHFLKSKRAVGYLHSTIEDDIKSGIYTRHGWKKLENNTYFFDGRK